MELNPNDPKYLQALVQGLQQQRNQANDTIAHLAATAAQKDEQIKTLTALVNTLQSERNSQQPAV